MLDFRLKELENVVDYHILCESTTTFSGLSKPAYFSQSLDKYEKYKDKIINLVYSESNTFCSPWKRELEQRNYLKQGLLKLSLDPSDIILLCDVDEIPDTNVLKALKEKGLSSGIFSLRQDMYYYNIECKLERSWMWPKVFNYSTFLSYSKEMNDIRISEPKCLEGKGGWHLSYFGDVDYIINKIKSFSHQEFNNDKYLDKDNITRLIKENRDILLGGSGIVRFRYIPKKENKYLPKNHALIPS